MSKLIWNKTQENELGWWGASQHLDFDFLYRKKYSCLLSYIENIGYSKTVLDIGCGARTFTGQFSYKESYLLDSLIDPYLTIKNNLFNSTYRIQSGMSELPFPDNFFDIVFLMNCIDHIDPLNLQKLFIEVKRLTDYLFIYVDLRESQSECNGRHPFVFTKNQFIQIVSPFKKVFEEFGFGNEVVKGKNLSCVWGVYKK